MRYFKTCDVDELRHCAANYAAMWSFPSEEELWRKQVLPLESRENLAWTWEGKQGTYNGQVDARGVPHGHGRLVLEDKVDHHGHWREGKRHGPFSSVDCKSAVWYSDFKQKEVSLLLLGETGVGKTTLMAAINDF